MSDGKPAAGGVNFEVILEKRRRFREFKVKLDDGRRSITLLRPPEAETTLFINGYGPDLVARYGTAWEGWREHDLLPSGGEDEVAFHASLLRDVLADDVELLKQCGDALVNAANARHQERKAARGNSSST